MTPSIFLQLLVSSFSWTGFDLARKGLSARLPANEAVILLMFVQVPIFFALAFWEGFTISEVAYWPPAIASIILNVFANVLFLESLRRAPVSIAIPMLSFTPVFSSLSSWLLLGESLLWLQGLGIFVIVGSTYIVQSPDIQDKLEDRKELRLGLLLMIVVALLWSITPVADKICIRYTSPSMHAGVQCLFIGLILLIRFCFDSKPATDSLWSMAKRNRKLLLVAGIAACSALFFQLLVIRNYEVALFEALKRSFGLIGALAGGLIFFQESLTRKKALGTIGLGLGILLVLLAGKIMQLLQI